MVGPGAVPAGWWRYGGDDVQYRSASTVVRTVSGAEVAVPGLVFSTPVLLSADPSGVPLLTDIYDAAGQPTLAPTVTADAQLATFYAAAARLYVSIRSGPWTRIDPLAGPRMDAAEAVTLLGQAGAPDALIDGVIVRDGNGAAVGAALRWPDGATGTYTGTASATIPGAVDAYAATHVLSGVTVTFTQPAVTRDGGGAVVNRPALVVS